MVRARRGSGRPTHDRCLAARVEQRRRRERAICSTRGVMCAMGSAAACGTSFASPGSAACAFSTRRGVRLRRVCGPARHSDRGRPPLFWRALWRWRASIMSGRATSFYYSFLALPADRRHAIIAVWDFCRAVDDAVDEPGEDEPAVALARWREEVAACTAAGTGDAPGAAPRALRYRRSSCRARRSTI